MIKLHSISFSKKSGKNLIWSDHTKAKDIYFVNRVARLVGQVVSIIVKSIG